MSNWRLGGRNARILHGFDRVGADGTVRRHDFKEGKVPPCAGRGLHLLIRLALLAWLMALAPSASIAADADADTHPPPSSSPDELGEEASGYADEDYLDEIGLPRPCTGPYDWVRLTSGEWLRGSIYGMRNKRLEFRSKRLKTQLADRMPWSNLSQFRHDFRQPRNCCPA